MSHEGITFVSTEERERQDFESRPLARIAMTPEKVRVMITEGKGLEIDWQDGHRSAWGFTWLRNACPCATCVDERKKEGRRPGEGKPKPATLLPMYAPPLKATGAQPVGRYAMQFHWTDGHTGGIYSFEYLRRQCQCAECAFAADRSTETQRPN